MELSRKVLYQAIRDAASVNDLVRKEMMEWVASDDFVVVVSMAGWNPAEMRKLIGDLVEEPIEIRKEYVLEILPTLGLLSEEKGK